MITPAYLAFLGGGSFLSPAVFMILFVLVMILSLWAQFRVSSVYNKNAKIPSRGGITVAKRPRR
jgi:Zn-dependent membrane protease YugP